MNQTPKEAIADAMEISRRERCPVHLEVRSYSHPVRAIGMVMELCRVANQSGNIFMLEKLHEESGIGMVFRAVSIDKAFDKAFDIRLTVRDGQRDRDKIDETMRASGKGGGPIISTRDHLFAERVLEAVLAHLEQKFERAESSITEARVRRWTLREFTEFIVDLKLQEVFSVELIAGIVEQLDKEGVR